MRSWRFCPARQVAPARTGPAQIGPATSLRALSPAQRSARSAFRKGASTQPIARSRQAASPPQRTRLISSDSMRRGAASRPPLSSINGKVCALTVLPPIDRTHGRPERCGSGLRRQPTPLLPNVTRPGKKGGPDCGAAKFREETSKKAARPKRRCRINAEQAGRRKLYCAAHQEPWASVADAPQQRRRPRRKPKRF